MNAFQNAVVVNWNALTAFPFLSANMSEIFGMRGSETAASATLTLLVWWAVWSLLDLSLIYSPWSELVVLGGCVCLVAIAVCFTRRRQCLDWVYGHKLLIGSVDSSSLSLAGHEPVSDKQQVQPTLSVV